MKGVLHILWILILSIDCNVYSQVQNNNCNQAIELCPLQVYNSNNIGANKTLCPSCEDDFAFCFTPNNTVWFKFKTNNIGGNVQVDFTNLVFQNGIGQDNQLQASILSSSAPCSGAGYASVGNCVNNASGNFSLIAAGLAPNTEYYIVVNGDRTGAGITIPAEASFDLTINGPGVDQGNPSINLWTAKSDICKNEYIYATATLSNCPDSSTYKWYLNGVLVAQTDTNVLAYNGIQQGDQLTVENSCFTLCKKLVQSNVVSFNVYSFNINAGIDIQTNAGNSVQLNGSTSAPYYYWTPSFGVSDTSSLNPWVTAQTSTTYTLTAVENGCTLSDQVIVSVIEKLSIPSSFSPNNDGANDVWDILGIQQYPDCQITVYTRWGQIALQSTGYNFSKAWDGRNKSGEVIPGVYYYVIDLKNGDDLYKGSVTIVK